jgi:signal transduction histidine kinase
LSRAVRAPLRWRHSIKLRLLALFVVLALALSYVVVRGAQSAFAMGWREAGRPLLSDYIDRLAAEVAPAGTPDLARAQALTARLPIITLAIDGPAVRWRSHAADGPPAHALGGPGAPSADGDDAHAWRQLVQRTTRDGHRLRFGLDEAVLERRPRMLGAVLGTVLLLMVLAYLVVRRLLRPLDAIQAGVRRFGQADFSQPIALSPGRQHDELGEVTQTVNAMGRDIERMLQAQRALLLAMSHELRSPLTRARLNTELLPETPEVAPLREALLRDLGAMAQLIGDLLESERLSVQGGGLRREPTDPVALAREVLAELVRARPEAAEVELTVERSVPEVALDRTRLRLLLRNLLDNALRHHNPAAGPVQLRLSLSVGRLRLVVRDHGPGVPDDVVDRLGQPFYRPDSARTRHAGGVGLGLNLCRLVAQAHGGTLSIRNAQPGLEVTVALPA